MILSKLRPFSRHALTTTHARNLFLSVLALAASIVLGANGPAAQTGKFGFVLQRVSAADFDGPEDIVMSATGTHLYVADVGHHLIRVLQPFNLKTVSTISHKSLKRPSGISMGDDRRLYVADSWNDRIVSYDVQHDTADPARTYHKDLNKPTGVVKWRNHLYIVNQGNDSVVIRDASGKSEIRQGSGGKPGEFDNPTDILVAPEGYILVSDTSNNRLQIFSQALEPIKLLADKPYKFDKPTRMTLDEMGNIFVADTGNHRILVLNSDLQIVGQIGTGRRGDKKGRLDSPKGVMVRGGHVWVSDTGNDRILLYRYVIR
jgi:DNA-binding beta-propeller fold protein YncE